MKKLKKNEPKGLLKSKDYVLSKNSMKAIKGGRCSDHEMQNPAFAGQ